jgi:16S rRNA G527 N7-methylase RsmG
VNQTKRGLTHLDSLEGLQTRLFLPEKSAIDVGSGPGFPGLPLALAQPEMKWSFWKRRAEM